MSSVQEDLQKGHPRYYAVQQGKVVDREDPEGLYRVRVEIPGLIEKSAWAWPCGTMGGGAPQRGAWVVPDKGADVYVWFLGGDVERPVYTCAHWGVTSAGSEMPTEAKAVDVVDAHKIQTVHESSKVKIWVDERDGKEQLSIANKADENIFLQFDLTSGTITISATAGLRLLALGLIQIEGSEVTIQGRRVMPDSASIK